MAGKVKIAREANVLLELHLGELGLRFIPEFRFCAHRKWRFDYYIGRNEAIEIEGGIFSRGRHTRGVGYQKDLEKYRTAAAMGYRVFRFSTQEVLDGTAREFLKKWCCE